MTVWVDTKFWCVAGGYGGGYGSGSGMGGMGGGNYSSNMGMGGGGNMGNPNYTAFWTTTIRTPISKLNVGLMTNNPLF